MKKTPLLLSLLGLASLTGCATMLHQNINEVTTPTSLSKYSSIDDLLAKSPNVQGSKTYYDSIAATTNSKNKWVLDEYKIPVETLKSYCQNIEQGTFRQVDTKKTLLATTKINDLEGKYTCQKQGKTLWGADVNIVAENISDLGGHKSVTYKIDKINGESYDKKIQAAALEKKRQEEDYARRVENTNKRAEREKQAYLDSLKKLSYITKSTNTGTTICRHHKLEYRYIYGTGVKDAYIHTVIIEGVLEKNQASSSNVQVRLRGAKDYSNGLIDLKGKLNGSLIKSGEIVWDDRKHWYICN